MNNKQSKLITSKITELKYVIMQIDKDVDALKQRKSVLKSELKKLHLSRIKPATLSKIRELGQNRKNRFNQAKDKSIKTKK